MELVPLLLKKEGVTAFLSDKLSQDPLEIFFQIQQQQGRGNENPSVVQVTYKELTKPTGHKLYLDERFDRKLSWVMSY